MSDDQVYGFVIRACPQYHLPPSAYDDSAYIRVGRLDTLFLRDAWEGGRVIQPEPTGYLEYINARLEDDPAGREADVGRALARLPRHACETVLSVELQGQHFKNIPPIDLALERD